MTAQPSELISSLNVLPHVQHNRYITTRNETLTPGQSIRVVSNALQLSEIPSRFFIVCRRTHTSRNMSHSSSFLAIENINVSFNNLSGILSGAKATDLYMLSRQNGSQQSMYEFLGNTNAASDGASFVGVNSYATCGSVLILSSRDLQLADFLSNGSTGQFSFQFDMTVRNLDSSNLVGFELVVITELNGLFITQNGQSSVMSSLMTKDVVISSTQNQYGESADYLKDQNNGHPVGYISNVNLNNNNKMTGSGMGRGVRSGGGAFSGGAFQ